MHLGRQKAQLLVSREADVHIIPVATHIRKEGTMYALTHNITHTSHSPSDGTLTLVIQSPLIEDHNTIYVPYTKEDDLETSNHLRFGCLTSSLVEEFLRDFRETVAATDIVFDTVVYDVAKRVGTLDPTEVAHRSYKHPNGFYKLNLYKTNGRTVRLHFWEKNIHMKQNPHDHGWNFESHVIRGQLIDTHYVAIKSPMIEQLPLYVHAITE